MPTTNTAKKNEEQERADRLNVERMRVREQQEQEREYTRRFHEFANQTRDTRSLMRAVFDLTLRVEALENMATQGKE